MFEQIGSNDKKPHSFRVSSFIIMNHVHLRPFRYQFVIFLKNALLETNSHILVMDDLSVLKLEKNRTARKKGPKLWGPFLEFAPRRKH